MIIRKLTHDKNVNVQYFWTKKTYVYQGQGFFICHIINYTGYNQKWNVDYIYIYIFFFFCINYNFFSINYYYHLTFKKI